MGALPSDPKQRKAIPMFSGLIKYFPRALAAVAKHSYESNEQHNPGEPLHWAREKSSDHCDCIARHLTDYATGDKAMMKAIAWRALAQLELDEEENAGAIRKAQQVEARINEEEARWRRGELPERYRCKCGVTLFTAAGFAAHLAATDRLHHGRR